MQRLGRAPAPPNVSRRRIRHPHVSLQNMSAPGCDPQTAPGFFRRKNKAQQKKSGATKKTTTKAQQKQIRRNKNKSGRWGGFPSLVGFWFRTFTHDAENTLKPPLLFNPSAFTPRTPHGKSPILKPILHTILIYKI